MTEHKISIKRYSFPLLFEMTIFFFNRNILIIYTPPPTPLSLVKDRLKKSEKKKEMREKVEFLFDLNCA